MEFSSLWGMRVRVEGLLKTNIWRCRVNNSVGQFLHTYAICQRDQRAIAAIAYYHRTQR